MKLTYRLTSSVLFLGYSFHVGVSHRDLGSIVQDEMVFATLQFFIPRNSNWTSYENLVIIESYEKILAKYFRRAGKSHQILMHSKFSVILNVFPEDMNLLALKQPNFEFSWALMGLKIKSNIISRTSTWIFWIESVLLTMRNTFELKDTWNRFNRKQC